MVGVAVRVEAIDELQAQVLAKICIAFSSLDYRVNEKRLLNPRVSKLWRRAFGGGENKKMFRGKRGYSKAAAHKENKHQQRKKNLNGTSLDSASASR